MESRNPKSTLKYNKELIDLILNTDALTLLLANATSIIDIMNQSNDLDSITAQLTKTEHYATLKQVTVLSDYFTQVENCFVMDFIDHVLKKEESSEKIGTLQKIFCAIWVMQTLYQTNMDLYNIFSQPIEHDEQPSFTIIYGPQTKAPTDQVTYQFLFDPVTAKWECRRFSPERKEAKIMDDGYLLIYINDILTHVAPENLNPFIKKSLLFLLQSHEYNYQRKQRHKKAKLFFEKQSQLIPKVREFCQNNLPSLAVLNNIHIVHTTYFEKAKKKPALMTRLLADDRLFELINTNSLKLILILARTVEWSQLENLLNKELTEDRTSASEFLYFLVDSGTSNNFRMLSKFFFEHTNQEQLAQTHDFFICKSTIALSTEDLIKYRKQGKIRLAYPRSSSELEELYQSHPTEFPSLLEEMLASGNTITEIPENEEVLKHFLNLFFKHEGQWFYLIHNHSTKNYRARLLSFAMKMDAQRTLTIIKALTWEDSKGNKFLPVAMTAEEITKLVNQSPQNACALLDYADILETLKQETFPPKKSTSAVDKTSSENPFGEIRRFDLLNSLLRYIPASYGEKLLRSGILFAERGMPHFQHLTGFGFFGGTIPSGFISSNFEVLYDALPCSTFMSALTEGLVSNQNVDRLFLKSISNINLLELANVLVQFQHIRHLELTLSLDKHKQDNIIYFFERLKKTNPHLNFHIKIYLSMDKKPFEVITNYLSICDIKVISLVIEPKSTLVTVSLLDSTNPDLKNFLNACIKKICQNNPTLRQISVNGVSRSIFSDADEPVYTFAEFPTYNTHLFSMDALEGKPTSEQDETTEKLLSRNRNIYALKVISDQLKHFQNVLELLPWLSIHRMPVELVVDIFDRLNYRHSLPSATPPYLAILDSIKQLRERPIGDDPISQIVKGLAEIENFLTASLLRAYYRYKPHKGNIHVLEIFFEMSEIQAQVIGIIVHWYTKNQRMANNLDEFSKLNQDILTARPDQRPKLFATRSSLPLILSLDGILSDDPSVNEFCKMINKLGLYQKAVTHTLKQLRRKAHVEFQHQGSLRSSISWNDLALQSFDGIELRDVLMGYNPKQDISISSNILAKIARQIFADFDSAEKIIFKNIMQNLELYLKQKAKPVEKQCDRHKHLHKNNLFNLMHDDKIAIFKNSKPRLYQILQTQQKRLAASVSKCSVKLVLRHSGLFSIEHERKKTRDKDIISNVEEQISQKVINGKK